MTENNKDNNELSPGAILKQERLKQNLAIDHISAKLYLTNQVIGYLEEDDFAKLPGDVFIRGYLRLYAKTLGLDDAQIISSYEAIIAHTIKKDEELKNLSLDNNHKVKPSYWLVSICIFALLGVIAWFIVKQEQQNSTTVNIDNELTAINEQNNSPLIPPITAENTAQDLDAVTENNESNEDAEIAAQKEQSSEPKILRLTFSNECWVKIVDADNKTLIDAIYKKGQTVETSGKEPFKVNLGNGRGVQVSYAGEQVKFKLRNSGSASFTVLGTETPLENTAE